LHLNQVPEEKVDGVISISTSFTDEKSLFLAVANVIPPDGRAPRFLWASDQIIPLQSTSLDVFERVQGCSRFFSGFFPDYRLLNIEGVLEPTIPCGILRYSKMQFSSYDHFLINFISGRHKTFAFIASALVLPNISNKPKRPLSSDLFQIVHISPHAPDQQQLNETVKELWTNYIRG